MVGSAVSRRDGRARRALVALQVALLMFALVIPPGTIAADPTEPPASSPPAEPTAAPSADPTAVPSADPTAVPSADPTAAPTAAPSVDTSAVPSADPTAAPDPTSAPSSAPASAYIVTFVAGTSGADQTSAITAAGAADLDSIPALRMHAVAATADAMLALDADPRVDNVELDRSRATEATPDDTSYLEQWALPTIGWDLVYGTPITGTSTVAILDTGVDGTHPDLAGKLVPGTSLLGGASTTDSNGHGTAMAGIIAAGTNNGSAIAGVGYAGIRIMPVTVLGADGTGRDSDVIEGLVWATDHGADVALMAFSAYGYSAALQAAVDYAWSHGVVLVAATGNDGATTPAYPAGDRGVVGVSSTDQSDTLDASSNHGADTFLAAPGTGIITLVPGGGTSSFSGTSAAAAHVAGAAALLRAADGTLSNGVIVGRLARTADAVGTAAETGNGRLNLARAFGDGSTEAVKPSGAAPSGDGGPFVGPYVAAGNTNVTGTVVSSAVGNPVISGASVACTAGCGDSATTGVTGAYSVKLNYSGTSAVVTLTASKPGFTSQSITTTVNNNVDRTINFTLTPANTAPTANNDSGTTDEDTDLVVAAPGVVGNDTDPNPGTTLTVAEVNGSGASVGTEITLGSGAKLTVNADGSYTYKPNGAFEGLDTGESTTDTFTYKASDGSLLSNSATVTITINGVNDAPVAVNTTTSVGHLDTAGVDVTLSATDADGDAVTFVIVLGPDHGALGAIGPVTCTGATPNACSSTIHFTPDAGDDFVGDDSFTYQADDGTVASNVATATVTMTNAAPTATASLSPADPTTNQTLTATATADDADGDAVLVTYIWKNGTVVVQTTGPTASLTDTLDLSVLGNGDKGDSISVAVTPNDGHVDGAAAADTELVANSAPTITTISALPDSVNEGSGTVVSVTAADDDLDTLSYAFDCENDGTFEIGPQSTNSTTCTYDDGPASKVAAARVTDTSAADDSSTIGVSVLSVAPTGTFGAGSPVDEGSPSTLSWTSVTDPSSADTAAGFHYSFACSGLITDLTGSYAAAQLGNTSTCTFADDGSYGVAGRVLDKDSASSTTGASVTVRNVAPELSGVAVSDPIDENGVATLTGTITDPGTLDTFTLVVDWGDGSAPEAFNYPAGATSFSETHQYVDDNPTATASDTYSIDLDLSDDDGGADAASTSITVNNVAPTLGAASITSPVAENGTATLTGLFSDPGSQDTFSLTVDWGDGLPVAYVLGGAHGFSVSHQYLDDNPTGTASDTYVVSWIVTDDDTGSDSATADITVDNVVPTVNAGAATGASNEGSAFTRSGSFSDPGTQDTWSATVDYGDGSGSQALTLAPDKSFSLSHTYDDNGTYTISVTVTDDDTGAGSDTISVSVSNVAPTATFNAPSSVDEGSPIAISLTDPLDPSGADTLAGFEFAFDCGAGYGPFGSTSSASCPTTDNGSRTVKGAIRDKDGGATEYTATVIVANVAPTTSAPTFSFDPVTHVAIASFSFADAGTADTHANSYFVWTLNGVDATFPPTSLTESGGAGIATSTRTLGAGCYTITVKGYAVDDDGGVSGPQVIASAVAADAYAASFQAPIKDNERNIAKYGNVVPVKVAVLSSCTGAAVTSPSLFITVHEGLNGEFIEDTNIVATSVSGADTGTQMRVSGGGYIYNLSTKGYNAGRDYAIRIRSGSATGAVILQAVLQPKK